MRGIDVRRKIAFTGSDRIDEEIESTRARSPSTFFRRAVVVEVIFDPALLTDDIRESLSEVIINKSALPDAPRNSIIVRPINDAYDRIFDKGLLCYPLLSSHIQMPIKPAEQVWIFSESCDKPEDIVFWLDRVGESIHVEDVNYTHGDRKFDFVSPDQDANVEVEIFNNGLNDEDGMTLSGGESAYDDVFDDAIASSAVVLEPVPRYTKRPGDLVLNGSNNSTIVLGTDRGYSIEIPSANASLDSAVPDSQTVSSASKKPKLRSGVVDIVVGRGRHLPKKAGDQPRSTAPRVVKNSRDELETDKNQAKRGLIDDNRQTSIEGDPDFVNDSSRVYVAMRTDVDSNFGLTKERLPKGYGQNIEPLNNSAGVIVKSDHVRIVARKGAANDVDESGNSINGTIRIVKEGSAGAASDDSGMIFIEKDGTIYIKGNKIYIGTSILDGGRDDGIKIVSPSDGAKNGAQPLLRYSNFESMMVKFFESLTAFCTTLEKHTTPGYGAPSAQIVSAAFKLKSDIGQVLKPSLSKIQSSRVFCE